ncbi:hypothetical protein G7046_g1721 [Stylonectria norvegica]|nr:hypothetical protein G7046_g1721 [Stylonectria norvegica]
MNQPADYTPLESLFLFQALLTHGADPTAFARISELLINNALIKEADTYDPTRLSADALQQLFLRLLWEEVKSEADRADGSDGAGSTGSRKRKLGTPPLPTLKDAHEHVEKIPALVDRLYARYRDHVVKQIREDERRFEKVSKEIQVLERTERERRARAASQNGAPVLAPREVKPAAASNGGSHALPSPSPASTPAVATKRGPTSNTPVVPPRPLTPHVAPPTVAPPSHLPRGHLQSGHRHHQSLPTAQLRFSKPRPVCRIPDPGHCSRHHSRRSRQSLLDQRLVSSPRTGACLRRL